MACSSSPSKAGLENELSSPAALVLDGTCEAHLLGGFALAILWGGWWTLLQRAFF